MVRHWIAQLAPFVAPVSLVGACLYPEINANDSERGTDASAGSSSAGSAGTNTGGTSGTGAEGGTGGMGLLGRAVQWKNGSCAVSDLIPGVTGFENATFTVEMLIQITSSANPIQTLVYRGGNESWAPTGWTVELSMKETDYALALCGGDTVDGGATQCTSLGPVTVNTPHHIAVIRDRTKQTGEFFISDVGFAHFSDSSAFFMDWPTTDRLSAGGTAANCQNAADAIIDELRIWSLRRDADLMEFQAKPVACNTPGLEAYYQFDEPDGSNEFVDCTGKSGNLTALKPGFELVDSPFDD